MIKYNFGKQYTKTPGFSKRIMGDKSAEEFREEYVEKWIKGHKEVEIDISDIITNVNAAYVNEAFGKAAKKHGYRNFKKYIHFKVKDSRAKRLSSKIDNLVSAVSH